MKIRFLNGLHARVYEAIFRRLAQRRPPHAEPIHLGPSSRVLLFTCAGIGDTLTDSVVFKALAETFPGIHLAGVVHKRRRALLEHNPLVREIFTIEKGPFAFLRLHRQLKAAGPWDAIIHLRGNDPEPRCQSFLLNPDVTVSIPSMTQLSWLCGHNLPQPDWSDTHGVLQTLRITDYLSAKTAAPTLIYEVKPQESAALEAKLPALGIGSGSRLVFQIGGGRRASWRDWPTQRWAELVALALSELGDARIILLSGRDNLDRSHDLLEKLRQLTGQPNPPVHNLVGQLNLTESAALLASSRAVVSTDTGIMHLSFAVGARVVALIHCNNPSHRVGPYGYGDRHRVVQLSRPENYRSPADADMAMITAETVLTNLKEIWLDKNNKL